jgi:nitrogen fixation protein FixH
MSCRWIPWAIAAGLAIVVAVNGALVYFAVSSSTGLVNEHPFELGNGYNRVIEAGAAQDALGWHSDVRFVPAGTGKGEITARFTDRNGRPVTGLSVTAHVVRPVEPLPETTLALPETAAGNYAAAALLARPGQWEVRLAARRGADLFELAQRIVVR